MRPGEAFRDAAHRGLAEELALHVTELIPAAHQISQKLQLTEQGIFDFEVQRLFFCLSDQDPIVSRREVAEIRFARLDELVMLRTRSPQELTPWFVSWIDAVTENELLLREILDRIPPAVGELDS